uniref:Uncharacterized protein n=1 Tax=Arundo donax TaxID=35708 RepID=A0A0A9BYU1_ARUDO
MWSCGRRDGRRKGTPFRRAARAMRMEEVRSVSSTRRRM